MPAQQFWHATGRYAIHELALMPDALGDDVKNDVRRALARSMRINARPLTCAEWQQLLTDHGLVVDHVGTAPMALLQPRRLVADEGLRGALRFARNLVVLPDARRRVLAMRRTFRQHRDHLVAVAVIAHKHDDTQTDGVDRQASLIDRSDRSARPSSMSTGPEIPRWLRAAFRLPERLYRAGLGSVLGRRFLRLSHRGRRSGTSYATVLEVVAYDGRIPEFVVVSGFGARADWLHNIEAGGAVEVTVGRRTFPVEHRRLELVEALGVFADYERRNRAAGPILRRVLSWLLGWRYDGSPDARVRMAEQLPLIAFRPRTS